MLKYTINRILISLVTIFVLITITFFLLKVIPDGLFNDPRLRPEARANLRKLYGLDKPLIEQYGIYLRNLARLDLGESISYPGRKITTMIWDPNSGNGLPQSMRLGMNALVVSIIAGVGLGTVAGLNRGKSLDKITIGVALLGVSIPSFVLCSLLVTLFGTVLHWLPTTGYATFRQMILPTFCLALGPIANISRIMRTSMVELEGSDFVKTAYSKGISVFRIVTRHQIRNALLPVLTILGPIAASLLAGTFVVEAVFNIKGLGGYFVESISQRDYGLVMGLTVLFGAFLILANLLVDLLYGLIDPRIRLGKQ
ncbi:dipeptide transport system permease protein DppB [Spirochaetia bacterium]|nr:dipeptide transport system permease protein DppB [Spirochaetia bacterium]